MRLSLQACAAASVVLLLLVGCESTIGERPIPTGPPSHSASNEPKGMMPAVGECRYMHPDRALLRDYWFDYSPVVSCDEPHTTETAAVWGLAEPTVEEAEQYGARCARQAAVYLDVTKGEYPAAVGLALYLPSQEQIASGQSWTRCDVLVAADTLGIRAAVRSSSMEGALGVNPAAFLSCTDRLPTTLGSQPLVSCLGPHGFELSGRALTLAIRHELPSDTVLARQGRRQCAEELADRAFADELAVYPVWEPGQPTFNGSILHGGCWVARRDGKPLEPMH